MSQVKVNCTSCQSRMRMQQLQKIGGVLKVRRAFAGHERVAFSQVGRLGHESRSPCQESRRSCKLCFQSHARHDLTGHRTFAGIFWLRCLTLRAMGCCVSCSPACQVIDRSPPASRVCDCKHSCFSVCSRFLYLSCTCRTVEDQYLHRGGASEVTGDGQKLVSPAGLGDEGL